MTSFEPIDFDILFPDVRESGETRLRQCQLVMLRMLKIFDYLCRKHNIQYFLTGGTLLGAIRHKGFIPWDDDLDIGMKRKEYEKFLKSAAVELPDDIFFQHRNTDRFYPLFHQAEAKLRDKYSRYFRTPELEKKFQWHNGIQVDIFVYDCAFFPSNKWIYLQNRLFLRYFKRFRNQVLRAKVFQFMEKYIPLPFVFASGFIERKSLVNTGANFIRKHEMKNFENVQFEDMQAWVPTAWDTLLKRQYGDYMQLPPEEKRIGTHSVQVADPFTPCNHTEVLRWENRKSLNFKTCK